MIARPSGGDPPQRSSSPSSGGVGYSKVVYGRSAHIYDDEWVSVGMSF